MKLDENWNLVSMTPKLLLFFSWVGRKLSKVVVVVLE